MNPPAKQYIAEFFHCSSSILDDSGRIGDIMNGAAAAAGANIVKSFFHQYAPQGVSGVILISESHLTIHTWPELRYAAVDLFTCSELNYNKALKFIGREIEAKKIHARSINRGIEDEAGDGSAVLEIS